MQVKFNDNNPGHIDWSDALYAKSFLPYFFVQTTGPLSQSYMYWLLSSFATDAQGMFPPFSYLLSIGGGIVEEGRRALLISWVSQRMSATALCFDALRRSGRRLRMG
jgi:hypothetical protein